MLIDVSTMQPNQQNPYDFITNTPQNNRGVSFGANSQKARLIQVGIGAIIFIIIIVAFVSFLSKSSNSIKTDLIKLSAAQQDIIEVSKLGETNVRDAQLQRQSASINAVITSQNVGTIAMLKKIGVKNSSKESSLLQDKSYTKTLDEASKSGNYDEAYITILYNRIDDYRVKLQTAYANNNGQTTKQQLWSYSQALDVLAPPATAN